MRLILGAFRLILSGVRILLAFVMALLSPLVYLFAFFGVIIFILGIAFGIWQACLAGLGMTVGGLIYLAVMGLLGGDSMY